MRQLKDIRRAERGMFDVSPQYFFTRFIVQAYAGVCSGIGIASIVAARQIQSDSFTPFQVR